ncbi:PepSY-associated TM helix domain-containing protein [Salininema proteolyticum]|uniref:PepSY domain-containing protein n=1 Tax=Salininema proteolyticum TaxID=1607685 RepID=A0ABV8TVK1_9ACTN
MSLKDDAREPEVAVPAPAQSADLKRGLRQTMLRLHFYVGILVAPFIFVAAFSGLLYALSYPVEDAMYADLTGVSESGDETMPLNSQVNAVLTEYPDATVAAVRPAPDADSTTQVLISGVDVPGGGSEGSPVAFVNPYTGEVQGLSTTYGSSSAMPVREWVSTLHRNLHLGEPGRLYSELAASWLWVLALGGLVLWFFNRRQKKNGSARAKSVRRHKGTGVIVLAVLLFLSATGLTWSTYAGKSIGDVRAQLGWTQPSISNAGGGGDHAHHGGGSDSDEGNEWALREIEDVAAEAERQGIRSPYEITLPTTMGEDFMVAERQRSFPVQQDKMVLSAHEHEVVDSLAFSDWPWIAKAINVTIALHMGLLFGLPNQIALALVMGGLVYMIYLGYKSWWQRRRSDSLVGRPFPRGGLRKLPWWAWVPTAFLTVLLCWFMPLFGIPLVAFFLVDFVVAGRRTSEPAG